MPSGVATRAVKAVSVVPKLVTMVEPEIPLRLLARLAKSALFVVGFRINPDPNTLKRKSATMARM